MATVAIAMCILKQAPLATAFNLAAEALGLRATGIGAFYDDEVHRHLNLPPNQGQVVYHLAIGYPVADRRLSAFPSTSNDAQGITC
jgi:nitroreductase